MSSVEEIAHKIAHEELPHHPSSPYVDRQALARRIAAALASERAKFAAKFACRLPPTHGDTILAVTPDGKEFVCAMEVDRLLKESEDRVLSDVSFRLGIDITSEAASDGVTCDQGEGPRPVPMYRSLAIRRLRLENKQLKASALAAAKEQP